MTIDGKLSRKNSASDGAAGTPDFAEVEFVLTDYLKVGNKSEAEMVERLSQVHEFLKGLDAVKTLYRVNYKVEENLKNDLKELDFLIRELRAVVANIARIRSNRNNVRKEMSLIKKTKEKKSQEGIQEIETIVAIYDKELLKKWHVAKKTNAAQSLENFVNSVAGKKQAVTHVYNMAMDRLAVLKKKEQCRPTSRKSSTFRLKYNTPTVRNRVSDTDTDSDEGFSLS